MTIQDAARAGPRVERWGPERFEDLLALCAAALPDEVLALDDLEAVLAPHGEGTSDTEPAPVVMVLVEGDAPVAAAAATLGPEAGGPSAHLQLLVVHPARRRRGHARRLVGELERWAVAHGSPVLVVGAGAPFYLFTGVDSRWTDALCCFEALGYLRVGAELDLRCPTVTPRSVRDARPRASQVAVAVGHVVEPPDVEELQEWVASTFPHWSPELARAARVGTALLARDEHGGIVGAAAHSVSRMGVVGPVAVDPSAQRSGVGAALMDAVLTDLATAGLSEAEIAWTSTVRFYARVCGARVGRTSLVLRRDLVEGAVGCVP